MGVIRCVEASLSTVVNHAVDELFGSRSNIDRSEDLFGQLVGPVVANLAGLGYRESYVITEKFAQALVREIRVKVEHVRAERMGNTRADIRAGVLDGSGGHSEGVIRAASLAASCTSRCRPASFRRGRSSPLRSSWQIGAQRVRCQRCGSTAVV